MLSLRRLLPLLLLCPLFLGTAVCGAQSSAPTPPPITPVNLGSDNTGPQRGAPVPSPASPTSATPASVYANSNPVGGSGGGAMPGSAEYAIRPGDTLALDFRLSPELDQTTIVDRDGAISLQIIGRVIVGGLTLDQAKALILSKESTHLVHPELNLQLTDFQHFYVVVAGEVYVPQKIEMRESMTALQAVMLAGGIKISGRETQVLLYRRINDEYAEVHRLNLHITKTVQMEHDMTLEPGDLIFVPRNKVESVSRYVRIIGLSYPLNGVF